MENRVSQILHIVSVHDCFDNLYGMYCENEHVIQWLPEIEDAFMEKVWKDIFGDKGAYRYFQYTLPEDYLLDEFAFYLVRYLRGIFSDIAENGNEILKEVLDCIIK